MPQRGFEKLGFSEREKHYFCGYWINIYFLLKLLSFQNIYKSFNVPDVYYDRYVIIHSESSATPEDKMEK